MSEEHDELAPELDQVEPPTFAACQHCGCTIARPCESYEHVTEGVDEPELVVCTRAETAPLCSRCAAFPVGFTNVMVRGSNGGDGEPQVIMPAVDAHAIGLDLVENSQPSPELPVDTSIVDNMAALLEGRPPPDEPPPPPADDGPQSVIEGEPPQSAAPDELAPPAGAGEPESASVAEVTPEEPPDK